MAPGFATDKTRYAAVYTALFLNDMTTPKTEAECIKYWKNVKEYDCTRAVKKRLENKNALNFAAPADAEAAFYKVNPIYN